MKSSEGPILFPFPLCQCFDCNQCLYFAAYSSLTYLFSVFFDKHFLCVELIPELCICPLVLLQFPSIKHSVPTSVRGVSPRGWLNAAHLLKPSCIWEVWLLFWTAFSLCLTWLYSQVALKPSPNLACFPRVKIRRGKSWSCFDFGDVFLPGWSCTTWDYAL